MDELEACPPSPPMASPSLRVTRMGCRARTALAASTCGTVVGVHARAANIALEGGPVVTLLPATKPLHPLGCQVDLEAGPFAARVTPLAGATVQIAGMELHVGELRFDFAGATTVDLRLRVRPGRALEPATVSALDAFIPKPAPEDPFEAVLATALQRFVRGGASADLQSLVGLGEGFTPAGDDALVGVLAGLDSLAASGAGAEGDRAALVAALPQPLESHTTRVAAQLLAAAIDGEYAEPLVWLLEALGNGERLELRHPALLELAGMGQRSGIDTLKGLLAVLKRDPIRGATNPAGLTGGPAEASCG